MSKLILRITIFFILTGNVLPLFAASDYDDQIKAMFIYNFTNFVKWPAKAFEKKSSPLTVCIYGEVTFLEQVKMFDSAHVRDRILKIHELKNEKQLKKGCHILYVGEDEVVSVSKILNSLNYKYILSVADMENFVKKGGMLNILRTGDGKKFRVNLQKVLDQGLKISPDLLEISEVI